MGSEPRPSNIDTFPTILKGREGRMNGQIIRYLALSGPSLIYSIAKDLGSRSETKIHYPTVNRRAHELVAKMYVEKAGTRITKSGASADLYANTIRGEFAVLAGIDTEGGISGAGPSPKEIQQIISNASLRVGSPFILLKHMINEGNVAEKLVDEELLPEVVLAIRNGYLNLDALNECVICSAFASIISRKITSIMATQSSSKRGQKNYADILMRAVDSTISAPIDYFQNGSPNKKKVEETYAQSHLGNTPRHGYNPNLTPISRQWCNELKVFLKLHSVSLD